MRTALLVIVVLAALGALLAGAVFAMAPAGERVPASALPAYTPNLANGKTIFYIGGCSSCHATPDQDDKTILGGGVEIELPYGSFYTPNISPHPQDGIGGWSEADFVSAILKGTSPTGRHYYPAFPYTSYQRMTLEDARDLFAFLKTLTPVEGQGAGAEFLFFDRASRAGLLEGALSGW